MDRFLNDQVVKQIDQAFTQLKEPVQILFFGSSENCEYCSEMQQLLEEVVAVNDKLGLKVFDIHAARDGEQISNLGVQFSGVPSGHEFTTLINDILMVSNRDSGLSPAAREFLKNLNQPLLLQVFVTPT
jgi:alkyl hydroperoxide reductase subunit AhpF